MATDRILKELQEELERLQPRLAHKRGELADLELEVRRVERAVKVLKGEPLGNPSKPPVTGDEVGRPAGGVRNKRGTKGISEEKVQLVQNLIMQIAQDLDEFRQVDVRSHTDKLNSSSTAVAFEILRQRGIIRFARQQGLNKWYRLTRAIANEATNGNGNDVNVENAAT